MSRRCELDSNSGGGGERADDSKDSSVVTTHGSANGPLSSEKESTDNRWDNKANDANSEMGKRNGEEDHNDESQERMLASETKSTPTKYVTEVKFENGDARIDIDTITQTLSGMGKEELMKFANDPFWVRLRWFLFISFWLLWAAMLAGAIAIIVMAPKCSAPEPKSWWEVSPIVRLKVSYLPEKDIKDSMDLLTTLQKQHIKAISLTPIFKQSPEGNVESFLDIDPKLGNITDLQNLIQAANKHDQHIVIELDPNHSSINHTWFKLSVNKTEPYTSYYVWADGKVTPDGKQQPPNNWLSIYGGSAWEWNEERKQYYLHQFSKSQPDLNFNSSAVLAEFEVIFKHWLKLGISGFRLANTRYLTEDLTLQNEFVSTFPSDTDNYQSLVHAHTRDRPENAVILRKWQEIVYNATNGEGLFALQDDIGEDMLAVYNEQKTLISLPQNSHFLTTANASIQATTLHKSISHWSSIVAWPGWDINGKKYRLRHRMPNDIADSITLMMMLLPGTPILTLNDTLSAKHAFALLAEARQNPTFLYGETVMKVVNETVFVYMRLKSGNPGYLVAYQSGDNSTVVDLSSLPRISEELTVLTYSPNYVQDGKTIKTKLSSDMVPISPKSTLILKFVPQK